MSSRNGWGVGSDHLVYIPATNQAPFYSKDGGKSWTRTTSFTLEPTYGQINNEVGVFNSSTKSIPLQADPFVADRYYWKKTYTGFCISTDGGVTWQSSGNNGLPEATYHGQLMTNLNVQGDLWFADGWDGASEHGIWHSTNSGASFSKVSGPEYAHAICLGAGRGQSGDASYTVYFFGKMTGDSTWGTFRSTNGGAS